MTVAAALTTRRDPRSENRNLRDPDECEPVRHADYGSGAYEDVSEAYDQDADILADNLGWE